LQLTTNQPLTALQQWKAPAAVSGCGQSQRGQTGRSPQSSLLSES